MSVHASPTIMFFFLCLCNFFFYFVFIFIFVWRKEKTCNIRFVRGMIALSHVTSYYTTLLLLLYLYEYNNMYVLCRKDQIHFSTCIVETRIARARFDVSYHDLFPFLMDEKKKYERNI